MPNHPPVSGEPTTDIDRLAFALEARDVQRGGSPHITPGNRFYREQAAALIALMPPPANRPPVSGEPLDAAIEAIEGVLTGMDWLGTGGSQTMADKEEREAWSQWDVILAALGRPGDRLAEQKGEGR